MDADAHNLLTLRVCADGDTRLKVSWADATIQPEPYFVDRTQFEAQAKRCRELLEQLSDRFVNLAQPDYGDLLAELAEEGTLMYDLLFDLCTQGQFIARQVKQYLNSLTGSTQITINTDAACHIPWALLYDANVPYVVRDRPLPEDFAGFWGLRYSIATLIDGMGLLNLKPPRPRARFRLLLVFDSKEYALVREHLTAEEVAFLEQLMKLPAGAADTWDAARTLWQPINTHDSLLYVFCHAHGSSLSLVGADASSELHVAKFRKYFSKKAIDHPDANVSATVCFLNGCSTAVGIRDLSFRSATGGPGFYGFIGTEASISNIFALKFSIAFFYYLLVKGWQVQRIFDLLRRRHWPLSLTYSNLAHPLFNVEPTAGMGVAPFDEDQNFSSSCALMRRGR